MKKRPHLKQRNSKLASLPPAQRAQIAQWLLHGVPTPRGVSTAYVAIIPYLQKELGVRIGKSALSDYFRDHVSGGARKPLPTNAAIRATMAGALRAVRAFQGLTTAQLAERAGVSPLELMMTEDGEADLAPAAMRAVETALNVPVGFFFRVAS